MILSVDASYCVTLNLEPAEYIAHTHTHTLMTLEIVYNPPSYWIENIQPD